MEESMGEEHHEGKEYFPWPHLRIRNKPFPWRDSDKTLFHNPQTNPRPSPEEEKQKTEPTSMVAQLWIEYLLEDPVKRDQFRWNHLARMQRRHEEYLAKRRKGEEPIQPMDLVAEVKVTPVNPVHSGIDN